MSRSEQSRVAQRGRAFALILAAAFAGACGDDEGGDGDKQEDSGASDAGRDASRNDGGLDARVDAGGDAGGDAARDGSTPDAGPLAMPGEDAPTLKQVGFYNDELGRRILIYGADKNGDIASYTISFFGDVNGTTPVSVDTDGDSTTAGAPSDTQPIVHDATYQDFLVKLGPSAEVTDVVKSIKIKVTDKGGRSSEEKLAKLEMAPQVGGTCDPNGFNRCSNNGICSPAANGNYSCLTVANARTMACSSPAVLSLTAGGTADGKLNNASFWDAPTGCVAGDMPNGLDDRIVKLTLTAPATTLTLATSQDTTFRSVIYQLPAATPLCSAPPAACGDTGCPACADGAPLVLNNVAAGDYFFVVERSPSELNGDTFKLTATVTP